MPDSALRLDGVWKAFDRGRDRLSVLEDVSLEIARGEIAAVVGGRDQGKTTLIRVASGMLPVDRGAVFVGGRELTGLSDRELAGVLANEIGVATRAGPETRLTVRHYVEMSLAASCRFGRRERAARVRETLDKLDLAGCAEAKWSELSNWQRVLVEFAQAIITRPRLLLVDDLVDGLPLGHKKTAMSLIDGFAAELRCAVLMAVSDHAAALGSAKVWRISHGELELMHADIPNLIDLGQRRDAI
jgi:ABC-type cobalamin/Fe3+-siderophores transport system ATPase subunit